MVACAGEAHIFVKAFDLNATRILLRDFQESGSDALVLAAVLDEDEKYVRRRVPDERRD